MMQRNLDGVYFRMERDGKWTNVCFSDLTEEEMDKVMKERLFFITTNMKESGGISSRAYQSSIRAMERKRQ